MNRQPQRLADLLPAVVADLANRHHHTNGEPPMTDRIANAVADITAEAEQAMTRWPPFNSAHEGYAVLLEEVDELWDDIKANQVERSIAEAIQVGAMALRYVVEMREAIAKGRAA